MRTIQIEEKDVLFQQRTALLGTIKSLNKQLDTVERQISIHTKADILEGEIEE